LKLKNKIIILLLFSKFLIASSCYSILTKTDTLTPVAINNVIGEVPTYSKCKYFDESILFDNHYSYIGCDYNKTKIENLYKRLKREGFHFEDEKIVKHKITNKDIYVIFPNKTHIRKQYNLNRVYKKYSLKNIEHMFPLAKNSIHIQFMDLKYAKFLPTINIYRIYSFYKKHNFNTNLLILYKGSITLEELYKKINNKNIIEKKGNRYLLKYPLYISPTATLIIKNKTLLLESYPKPVFVMYHGNLYIKDSKIYAWNVKNNSYYPHPYIPEKKILLIGTQRPRPYFIGLAGSKTIFLNNIVKGLGFHDTVGTFGIALVHYPRDIIFKTSSLYTFLGSAPKVTGIFEGNDIYDNMMGFYTNEAKNVVLLGNTIHNNIIYNVDPHDYSENLIIARNLTYEAHHAHGIVISRHVEDSIIAENFSFKNHSAGIMLDRLSNHNIIYKNLAMENGYMGITVQESNNVLVKDNYVIRNYIDGIIIRNSLRNYLQNNYADLNGKNGIEVYVKDLREAVYRDLLRDPYQKATSVILKNNIIKNNYNYNIIVKNSAAIKLINNELKNNNINKNYGGDLNYFLNKIEQTKNFTLYGRGQPFRPVSIDLLKLNKASLNRVVSIIRNISIQPNLDAGLVLAYIYKIRKMYSLENKELKRVSSQLISQALNNLGFSLLIKSKQHYYKDKNLTLNALSYIIEAAIMNNKNAAVDLSYLPILSPITKSNINKAYEIAKKRMSKGLLFDKKEYKKCEYCKLDNKLKNLTKSYLKIFLYNKNAYNFDTFYQYSLFMRNSMNLFSKSTINSIKRNWYEANRGKIKYYRVQNRISSEAKKNYSCQYYLNKKFHFKNEILSLMNHSKNQDLTKYSKLINSYIDKINQFRKRKLNKNKIFKLLKENNEKVFDIFAPSITE
jgi:poly(beta-D-mannuronate) C5 epimerase